MALVFSKLLKMPESHIMVVPKETPADPYILQAARDYGARIVSNDRFRDLNRAIDPFANN